MNHRHHALRFAFTLAATFVGPVPFVRAQFTYSVGPDGWKTGAMTSGTAEFRESLAADTLHYNQNGGEVTFFGNPTDPRPSFYIGHNNQDYTISAGTLSVWAATLRVGNTISSGLTGSGTFRQTGGTVTTGSGMTIGAHGSTYNMSGGELNTWYIILYGTPTSYGTFRLGGGTLSTHQLNTDDITSNENSGKFYFDGGTLRSRDWYGLQLVGSNFYVSSGGAKIDTAGYDSTVKDLQHDPALGSNADGGLIKTGEGTLTLNNQIGYNGTTVVHSGTLLLNGSMTGGGALVVDGGTFALGTRDQNVGSLLGAGGSVDLNSYALTVQQSFASKYAGNIVGTGGSLVKSGTGTLVLSGTNTYTGSTTIGAGTLQFARTSALAGGPLTVASGATAAFNIGGTSEFTWSEISSLFDSAFQSGTKLGLDTTNADGSFTISETISDSASGTRSVGLVKLGSGTLMLTGTNTYTGGTSVTAGTLHFTNISALPLTDAPSVASGATGAFSVGGTGEFTWSEISSRLSGFQSGSRLGLDTTNAIGGNLAVTNVISGSFGIAKLGDSRLTLSGANAFTGGLHVNGGVVEFANANSLGAVSGRITLDGGGLRWGSGSTTDISARLAPLGAGGGTFDTNGNSVTVATGLSGPGSLTKTGAGTLTLTAINSYTGGTTVTSGTLALGVGGQTGAIRGALTINSGATVVTSAVNALGWGTGTKVNALTINGGTFNHTAAGSHGLGIAYSLNGATMSSNGGVSSATAASHFSFDGGTSINVTGPTPSTISGRVDLRGDGGMPNVNFTVDGGSALKITAGISSHVGSNIEGPVALTKLGAGTLVLTGNNTYSGNTTINAGLIEFNAPAAFGAASTKVVLNGGGLRWAAGTATDISNRLNPLAAGGATFDTNGNNVSFATVLTGTGGVTKSGVGTLTLSTFNTYTGGTTVSAGTLELAGPQGTGAGIIRGNLVINAGATLKASASNALGNVPGSKVDAITLNGGSLIHNGAADLGWAIAYTLNGGLLSSNSGVSSSTTNSKFAFGGPTGADTTVNVTTDTTIAGRIDLRTDNGNTTSKRITVAAGANLHVTAALTSAGVAGFTKLGDGTMTLTGANTYTGGTIINAGFIQFSAGNNLGTGNITLNGGGLQWASGNTLDISPRLNAIGVNGATIDTNGNNVTLASTLTGGTLTKTGTGTLTIGGSTNNGTLVVKVAAGTVVLGKASSGTVHAVGGISGGISGVVITGGIAQLGGTGGDQIADNTGITVNGGTFDLNGRSELINSLNGTGGTITNSIPSGDIGTLTVSNDGSDSYAGTLTDGPASQLAFIKTGLGTLTLSGNNTYTGPTQITAGTLLINGTASGSGSVTVSNGATLGGTGSIGGSTTISNGGHLAPGNSVGTLTFTGGLSASNGAAFDIQLGVTSDLIRVTGGSLTGPANGTIVLNIFNSGGLAAGTYTFLDATGATLSNFDSGRFVFGNTLPGYDYTISQSGNSFRVTLTVPEPSTGMFLGTCAIAIVGFSRRRGRI